MAATKVALLVALAFVFLEFEGAAAGSAARLQVQNLLKQLNKAPVASIQSPDGDIIDCVHISKQPAFDHPLLKNHTIQMRPSYHPGGLYNGSNIAPHPPTQTWHQNGKCPENTVPIRRTREEDVLRASSVERYGKKRPDASVTNGHQYAEAYAPDGKYYGTEMKINLWQPTIKKASDFSLTQTWVTAGSYQNNDLNTIEAGWQVYPAMYGDDSTRLFIYWTRDAYGKTGCYNLCQGFVQTNNQFAIGGSLSPVSIYGGSQYEIDILIWKYISSCRTHNRAIGGCKWEVPIWAIGRHPSSPTWLTVPPKSHGAGRLTRLTVPHQWVVDTSPRKDSTRPATSGISKWLVHPTISKFQVP
ncbi:unnamed protein product [Urochloa humidicola]